MSTPTPEEIYERCVNERRAPIAFIEALAQYGYKIVRIGSAEATALSRSIRATENVVYDATIPNVAPVDVWASRLRMMGR